MLIGSVLLISQVITIRVQQEELKNIEEPALKSLFDLEELGEKDLGKMVALKNAYPYCQAFYLLAARCAIGTSSYEKHLAEAAAIVPSRNVLYDVIFNPEDFRTLDLKGAETVEDIQEEVFEEIAPHLEPEIVLTAEKSNALSESEINLEEITYELPIEAEEIDSKKEIQEEIVKPLTAEAPYIETLGDEFLREEISQEFEAEGKEPDGEHLPAVKQGHIFRYHEDRLPYTFLWWLNKTRKQYENIRPYADYYLDNPDPVQQEKDELEHQIVENIFHLTSVDEVEGNKQTVHFDFLKKEHQIIERFIKEEPHITAPRADKIDTENKAKKSSEDHNELVSETLAKIYVEQMLYHKALDIYRKLSLKYPEKNAYFASQIKYLELKVN